MGNEFVHLQVLAICLISGMAASCFHMFLWRKQDIENDRIKVIAFYFGAFYAFLSFLKTVLGAKDSTLFESFSSISVRTYLHYVPLVLAAGIALPVLIRLLFRKKCGMHVLAAWDSYAFLLTAIAFAVAGKITNLTCLCIFALSTALAIMPKRKAKEQEASFWQKGRQTAPAVAFFVITVVLCLPGEMYLNNIWEFHVAPWSYAIGLLVSAAAFLAVYIGGSAYFLTSAQAKFFSRILFALTLAGYLQNMFLNGYMVQMDGTAQTWLVGKCLFNGAIWLALIGGVLAAGARLRDKADKAYRIICIYVGLIQVVSLVTVTVTSKDLGEAQNTYGSGRLELTSDGIFELSSQNNIVVFILDWYDQQILDQILETDSDFLSPLDGFTSYTNASSLYAYTAMAMPYLLTGVEWEYDMPWHQYRQYAFENGSVFANMGDMGYNIEIYTDAEYLADDVLEQIENSDNFKYRTKVLDELYVMTKTAKYQMAPFAFKNYYWYTAQDLQDLTSKDERVYTVNSAEDDLRFHKRLMSTGLGTNDTKNLFKLIHMHGAHPPFGIDESSDKPYNAPMLAQAKDSMEIVFDYIEQMKEIGVYDSSTIIITADHGANYLYDPVGRQELVQLCLKNISSPILMVKHPNQNGGMSYSNAPVSQKELVAQIMQAVNPAIEGYGRTLEEIDEDEEYERIFIYKKGSKKYVKSKINGDVKDLDSWEILEGLNLDQLK